MCGESTEVMVNTCAPVKRHGYQHRPNVAVRAELFLKINYPASSEVEAGARESRVCRRSLRQTVGSNARLRAIVNLRICLHPLHWKERNPTSTALERGEPGICIDDTS